MSAAVITTERLKLRNWIEADIEPFAAMCQDEEVMRHFPHLPSYDEVVASVRSAQQHFSEYGFNYFATEVAATGEFIGFVGLKHQTYASPFTPCVDIGWRLRKCDWGIGYATEAAMACLDFAFGELNLESVASVCAHTNGPSEAVMKRIGMKKVGQFEHPQIPPESPLNPCLAYRIDRPDWISPTT